MMKCSKTYIVFLLKVDINPSLDPFQYAYRQRTGTDDAFNSTTHLILKVLEDTKTCTSAILFPIRLYPACTGQRPLWPQISQYRCLPVFATLYPDNFIFRLSDTLLFPVLCTETTTHHPYSEIMNEMLTSFIRYVLLGVLIDNMFTWQAHLLTRMSVHGVAVLAGSPRMGHRGGIVTSHVKIEATPCSELHEGNFF